MASMSKRTQARNERELHALLSLPGNSQCADCGASNPAWASWNLGAFLCMRCASLHRKLGTHISKVKSLSMDTWSTDQVEVSYGHSPSSEPCTDCRQNMKRNGNNAVNKIYNPKNKKPDIPLDADEVDSAMERFIRKKYQEKSLSDGRPEPPQRDEPSQTSYSRPIQQEDSPPPPLPPKKGKFFGFGLRASSALPSSKHDKKKQPKEPRVDSAFRIAAGDYDVSRMSKTRRAMTDAELQQKLATLRDMGFTDMDRNTHWLLRLQGNVERTVETLVRLGPSENEETDQTSPSKPDQPSSRVPDSNATTTTARGPQAPEPSYNPFTQMTNQETVGLSMATPREPATPTKAQSYSSNNPYGQAPRNATDTGLEQSLQSMQLTQPLFPHSTGGYPSQHAPLQDPRMQYSMTPPVSQAIYQQQGFVASPAAIPVPNNPFFQPSTISAQSTGNNPFLNQVPPSPSTNPFLSSQGMPVGQPVQPPQKQNSLPTSFNPFGIPPSQSPPQAIPQINPQFQPQDLFGSAQQAQFPNQPQPVNPFQTHDLQQQQQSQAPFPNFQYAQPQTQIQHQPQRHMSTPQFVSQNPYQQNFNPQPQSLMPQQTGRYDKNSIMALYNFPQLAPQPLASIPEPASEPSGQQQGSYQQQNSPAPMADVFGSLTNNISPAKRSATMPVSLSHMHSAGGSGNRNPFMTNTASAGTNANVNPNFGPGAAGSPFSAPRGPGQGQGIIARHTSSESVSINNLDSGRHSPDAFANLSARYMG